MKYLSLYRKHRPKNFDEVIGQDKTTLTLKNQIKTGKIGHAYLFSGTRGTGKTSTAKIFARAINCLNPINGNPCNECELCLGILENTILDVTEMDAASNNSVDDIREIREKVKYLPTRGKYKVYIIDEVHMLSKGAFNAILKTLEEPPSHIVFILATTEPNKLLPTIKSRCQSFDFKRLSSQNIKETLSSVCEKESLNVEEDALMLVAKKANGAMRDALSLLETISNSSVRDVITHSDALDSLGLVDDGLLYEITSNIINSNTIGLIDNVSTLYSSGKDIITFFGDLIQYFRNILVVKGTNKTDLLIELSNENREKVLEISNSFTGREITNAINLLSKEVTTAKNTIDPRITLETTLLSIAKPEFNPDIEEILEKFKEKIDKLETQVNSLTSQKNTSVKTETFSPENKEVSKSILLYHEVLKFLDEKNFSEISTFAKNLKPIEYKDNKFILGCENEKFVADMKNLKPKNAPKSNYFKVIRRAVQVLMKNSNIELDLIVL